MKTQALCPTPKTSSALRPNHASKPEPPPTTTRGNSPRRPPPECEPSSKKPRSLPIPRRVHREKQGSISDAVTAIATEGDLAEMKLTKDLHLAGTNNFKTRFWKCEHCLLKFPQKWALQVHSCRSVLTKPYLCSNCGKAFADKGDVQAHASRCGGGRKYKCGYCGRSFLNANILGKHIKVHSKKSVVAGAFRKKTMGLNYERHVQ